jgi:protein-tyrosine-phosphatase
MLHRPPRWLWVCSGNICRSPMGYALSALEADHRDLSIALDSAGTLQIVGAPADPKALTVAAEIGADLSAHRSQALTVEKVAWADHILVMTDDHLAAVARLDPDAADRTIPVGRLIGRADIADPHGSWFMAPYRRCRDDLVRVVDRLFASPIARPVRATDP